MTNAIPGQATSWHHRSGAAAPDFKKPPVVETSAGFHFIPIQGWTVLHYGLLWGKLSARYQKSEFHPPVLELAEIKVDSTKGFANLPVRVSFVDTSNTNLVQVQNNFILHNWRKSETLSLYQHYSATRDALAADWTAFRSFLSQHSLNFTQVVRCEASYFNHLVRGESWQSYSDLPELFPAWKGTAPAAVLSAPQMIGISGSYSRKDGMLQIAAQPALRQDGREIIQLTITATGGAPAQDDDSLFACLDECHQSAVQGFVEFTSEKLHSLWERVR
jgi:uncharacterized protein (TIGR04255 family)